VDRKSILKRAKLELGPYLHHDVASRHLEFVSVTSFLGSVLINVSNIGDINSQVTPRASIICSNREVEQSRTNSRYCISNSGRKTGTPFSWGFGRNRLLEYPTIVLPVEKSSISMSYLGPLPRGILESDTRGVVDVSV
jgi:hypothetical protein